MTIEERAAPDADARISGTERAWIEAFSPSGSRAGLAVEGDERLADAVLEALRLGAAAAASSAGRLAAPGRSSLARRSCARRAAAARAAPPSAEPAPSRR